jgi:hypothetical protein
MVWDPAYVFRLTNSNGQDTPEIAQVNLQLPGYWILHGLR